MAKSHSAREWNFDGLVGPTHNYAGLSIGNVASVNNAKLVSNPREAALEGLEKMWALLQMGVPQGIIAPQDRPHVRALRELGFSGSDQQVLAKAKSTNPQLLSSCFSASSMWAANSATVSPSADTADHRVHFTPANLTSKLHRSFEFATTSKVLKSIFPDEKLFAHHPPLSPCDTLADEGAANHTRLCRDYGDQGVEFFVYGRVAFDSAAPAPKKFPARQTLESAEAIIRRHQLAMTRVVFAQQNPGVIDQGVFHNDVICVGNRNFLFYHSEAFLHSVKVINELQTKMDGHLETLEVKNEDLSVTDAIKSYLFNSQLITLPTGQNVLIAPEECRRHPRVFDYLESIAAKTDGIQKVHYFNVTQSMQNGGGPACLRLRVVLNDREADAINQSCVLTARTYTQLKAWITKHYRDRLSPEDFGDVKFITESHEALDQLSQILQLGSVYDFQLDPHARR